MKTTTTTTINELRQAIQCDDFMTVIGIMDNDEILPLLSTLTPDEISYIRDMGYEVESNSETVEETVSVDNTSKDDTLGNTSNNNISENDILDDILEDDMFNEDTFDEDTFDDLSIGEKDSVKDETPENKPENKISEDKVSTESKDVVTTEPLFCFNHNFDIVEYLYNSFNYINFFLKPVGSKSSKSKRKPRIVRRKSMKLNKIERNIYSVLSSIESEFSYKLLDLQIRKYIIQLDSDAYKKISKFIYRVMSGIESKIPKQTLIGKLRFKLPRLPLKDVKDSRLYEEVIVKVSANLIQVLLNKEVFKSEPSRHINRQTGELSSVVWVYRPDSIKFNIKHSGRSHYVVDPYSIRIRGTSKAVSITSPMKKFIDKYANEVNRNIRFKQRPIELVDIYFGLLYYKLSVANPDGKESVFDLKDRLLGYREKYEIVCGMSLDKVGNKMYYDTRGRMYSTISFQGLSLHGDKFESSNRECANEYILEPDDIRRLKSHAVQVLSSKKLSQQDAEPLFETSMVDKLREPLTNFYKDILIFSKRLKQFDKRFMNESNPFSLDIVREFCLQNNIPHQDIIRNYGKWVYNMELSKEVGKSVGDKSRFLLKEDTTNMGILLSSLAFKSKPMAKGTNILKGKGIVDTHQLNLDFVNKATGSEYTRNDIKVLMSNPLNHGAGLKSISNKLSVGIRSLKTFIIKNYGVSFLNFNIIASWIKNNYPNNGIVTWKLPDGFVARSVAYSESQKLSVYVIDNPREGRNGKLYPAWKTVELIQDLPISRIGNEYLNTGDKSLKVNGGYANGDHAYESYIVRKVLRFFFRTNRPIFTTHDAFDMRGRDLFVLERLLNKYFKKEVDKEVGYYDDMCKQIAKQLNIEPPLLYREEDELSSSDIADTLRCIIP